MTDEKKKGVIFDIQRWSLHDGPGIRTNVFFKGCPLSCQWCSNPESQEFCREPALFGDKCIHCLSCVEHCPHGAIHTSDPWIRLDYEICRGRCSRGAEQENAFCCTKACYAQALTVMGEVMTADMVLEEVMRDEGIYRSSGGGVTMTGGEPLAQPEFLLELLTAAKERGLHTVMDINIGTLREIGKQFNEEVNTQISNRYNIKKLLPEIDVVYNCVKWPKDAKEFLIDREMVRSMEKGSVIVDISNDVGAIETFHETTHDNPRYIEEGVVHYCVSNIPGAIAQSTSIAYAASVLPHFRSIMKNGVAGACERDGYLRRSLTTYKGFLTHEETSAIQGRPWIRPEDVLQIADRRLDPAPPATGTKSGNFIQM